ncbi:DUF3280 domain-containing protein [Methylobacterium brachythecii]|uniref:DUF2380 domain-containing protein n=1 Tax=Methylobacterium brachythecii TaxID=1176177 RepID=A0A7W6AH42_9HYPH|nr:DUF3280 domain-containing protein [Methylobacterium brachythecii]MBB3902216.1 hypothetical protein [Methylobacterium brachythecii]GLS42062.1 hypothetical protein GCM10007884_00470 [Methylobacterium brachythecii]
MTPTRLAIGGLAAATVLGLTAAVRAEPEKVAVFDFQFAHGAPTPPTEDDKARLKRTSDEFRTLLKDTGRYTLVPTDPVKDDVAKTSDLRACGGCADTFGKALGADSVFVGEVQKVSNLILNINVYHRSLKEGAPEKAFSVDLRGNTDESFDRGIKYLVKNQLLER